MFRQLGLVGCGLMGGSFALAMKKAGLVDQVVGYSASDATSERAQRLGVIDARAPSAGDAVANADLVLIAVPVAATGSALEAIRPRIADGTLIMDVGSTKRDVVTVARPALAQHIGHFVPAHPIAGKELAGVEHADAMLYAGRQVILTPTQDTYASRVEQARQLWTALGCQVRLMSPEAHDAAFAAVSHLPHLLAFALMNAIGNQPDAPAFLSLAGPGFRDFTRIAASDPAVWRDILIANKEEVLAQTRHFRQALEALETAIGSDRRDALQAMIDAASTTRAHWRMTAAEPRH
ncbi:MAG: prephenate dehydrogenase [Hydrogenophaga sp.]